MADNEGLRRDNTELQALLATTREELRALQDELEERRATDTPYNHEIPASYRAPTTPTFNFGTAPAPSAMHTIFTSPEAGPSGRRSQSVERGFKRGAVSHLNPNTVNFANRA